MQAEPSQDARADQPTETICMFTLRGDDHKLVASEIRTKAQQAADDPRSKSKIEWTQTTRVIPTEDGVAERDKSETKTRYILVDNRGRVPTVVCSQSMTTTEAEWRNEFVPRPEWCGRWIPAEEAAAPGFGVEHASETMPWCDGCQAYRSEGHDCNDIPEPSHGPALSPRGHDFVELLRGFSYVAGAFVLGLGLASLIGWLVWTH